MKRIEINGEPLVFIPKSGWIELAEVLREFVCRADAGSRARESYQRCMEIVSDANPELRQG